MSSSILVIGASGFVGTLLTKELLKRNVRFKALIRPTSNTEFLRDARIECVEGDLCDKKSLKKALLGVQRVFLNSPLHPDLVELQGNLLKSAAEAQVQQVVKLSVLAANPESDVNFFRWHGLVEQHMLDLHVPFTLLRSHYLMQNTLSFAQSLKDSQSIFLPMGNGQLSMVDARDVAELAAHVLTTPFKESQALQLTGPQGFNFTQVAQILSETLARRIRFTSLPPEALAAQMQSANMPDWLVDGAIGMYRYFEYHPMGFTSPIIEKLLEKPSRDFRQFAADYAPFFLA